MAKRELRTVAINVRLTRRELNHIEMLALKNERSLSWMFRKLIYGNTRLLQTEKHIGT
jgi:hypothetical protein